MNSDVIKKIEDVFRNSRCSDELFDFFGSAVKIKLCDTETYKILLANPTLSPDEIRMFTEKLIKEIPESAFSFLLWTGRMLENYSGNLSHADEALVYYQRAALSGPGHHEPLIRMLNLYNYEIDLPYNIKILEFIEEFTKAVDQKSKVYYALAGHYKKCGDSFSEAKYSSLAEKSVKNEKGVQHRI